MRIAILGCGSIGRRHARNLRALGHDDLLAYDPDPAARSVFEEDTGIAPLGELEEVWQAGPEVALVTAPSNLHVPLATEAARRGCHLFVEKPLSHSLEGVDGLLALVAERGLVTMVGCNMRFHPGPAEVKRQIDAGAIGAVLSARLQAGSYLPRWRPWQDHRESYSASREWGGAVLDLIHEIDLALWYQGPARVVGAALLPGTAIGVETDGLAEILLRHASGALSSVHLNFVQRDYRRGCQVIGGEGTLYWDFMKGAVERFDGEGSLAESIEQPAGWEVNRMYLDEMSHFLDAVRAGEPTVNPLAGGVAALEVALEARRRAGEEAP